jgi:hypothetical protein
MVWPIAFPLEAFLTRAGITALGTAATSEGIKSLQNQGTVNPGVAKEAFMRTLMGPTTEILNRTTDTPSGKVFAPTGEVIESNQIPGMAPAEQPQGLPGLLPPQQEKQVEGMSQASPPTKDKGFTMPTTEDMSILYKVEDGEPKYKYPTEEEIKKYINEENEFWEQNAQRANEKYPELSSNNLPKLVEADKHFGAAAHSFQDFKNSKLIYMKPQEYLDLTRKFRPAEGEEKLGSKMNVKNIENILQQGKELANIPMLYVKKVGDGFEINGQEGIHRAKAFNNLGYDRIPVVIEGATKKEREELKDFIPSSIQSEDGEVLLTKPEDFYSVIDKKPLINKDQSYNLKGLVSRSVGQEKGIKGVDEIYNDQNFSDVLTPDQQKYINDLEYSYVGGVGDLGNPLVPAMFMDPTLTDFEEYMEGYQEKLADIAKKELGNKFKAYRLMDKNTAMKMMQGEIPNTKVMQWDDEAGQDKLVDYEYEGMFGKTTVPQEAMGFSLSPKQALAFRDFSFSGARQKKDEDFVLMEYDAAPTDIVMRGHPGEKELVLRTGDATPRNFTIYDVNFLKTKTGRDITATKNKEFEKMKQDYESKRSKTTEKNTSKSAGSLIDKPLSDE